MPYKCLLKFLPSVYILIQLPEKSIIAPCDCINAPCDCINAVADCINARCDYTFDTDAIAETASKVQDAAVQVMLGPTTIAPSVGGGGGGSSKGWGDDDDDDEKKKKKNQVKRGR